MRKQFLIFSLIFALTACIPSTPSMSASVTSTNLPIQPSTITPSKNPTSSSTVTSTPTNTTTPTNSPTVTITETATLAATATITSTPTFTFPAVKVHTQAHCRYGPSSAYLHAADLYPGDTGTVRGRYVNSKWLHVKFDKLNYWCWVSPSVIDVSGDISTVKFIEPNLQTIGSNMYGPPQNINASRNGDQVTITWSQMNMTEDDDRGYFIEAWVCQNGAYLWWTVSFPNQYTTTYSVLDQTGCKAPSSGVIYTVEKHGYSQPSTIPWP